MGMVDSLHVALIYIGTERFEARLNALERLMGDSIASVSQESIMTRTGHPVKILTKVPWAWRLVTLLALYTRTRCHGD